MSDATNLDGASVVTDDKPAAPAPAAETPKVQYKPFEVKTKVEDVDPTKIDFEAEERADAETAAEWVKNVGTEKKIAAAQQPAQAPGVNQQVPAPQELPNGQIRYPDGTFGPKPPGYDPVDFSKIKDPELRQQFQDRFNHVYRQLKEGKQEHRNQWEEARRYIEGLEGKLDELKSKQTSSERSSEEAVIDNLQAQANAAFAAGNHQEGSKLLVELARREGELAYKKAADKKEQEDKQAELDRAKAEAANQQIPAEAVNLIKSWQQTRPYAQPGHPWQPYVVQHMTHMLSDPQYAAMSYQEILEHTTKLFDAEAKKQIAAAQAKQQPQPNQQPNQPQRQQIVSNVLPGNGVQRGQDSRNPASRLSDQQKVIAAKMFSNMPREKAFERYARNLDK